MVKSQSFRFAWKCQQPTVLSGFCNLLENGKLLDMTLAAGGERRKAHKLVLSACSPYFEKLLTDEFDKHPVLMLREDIKPEQLEAIMDYMYKGEVYLSIDKIQGFLKAARALQIRGLNGPDTLRNLTYKNRPPDDGACSSSTAPGPDKQQILTRRKLDNDSCQASTSSDTRSLTQNITSPTIPSRNNLMDRVDTRRNLPNGRAKKTGLGPLKNEAKVQEVFLTPREVIDPRKNLGVMKIVINKKVRKLKMSSHQFFL
ncbi:unnamed protein product [Ceutorhynchus assimilis]|uniref:BTB domain-containing protein n=1 Tax=Ceutorhynchus assimilis TaxID=467358 RepID=A0A9P0GJ44_9CUCU|nr:unnamed protein product [Ceutorhynchus assimilis]